MSVGTMALNIGNLQTMSLPKAYRATLTKDTTLSTTIAGPFSGSVPGGMQVNYTQVVFSNM